MRLHRFAPAFFWTGLLGWLVLEVLSVYFIMPFPGSQEGNTLDLAYTLYQGGYIFRIVLVLMMLWGWWSLPGKRRWYALLGIGLMAMLAAVIHFRMQADYMFLQPRNLVLKPAEENDVDTERLVIGVHMNGQAKAYPIRFLAYHHQVLDTLADRQIMVTYCNVCRSGRVYEPVVEGKPEQFRLVGMDHFNAMFEDASTGSWWRQATGEAVTGTRKGMRLPELFSEQAKLADWIDQYPHTLIMQADESFQDKYDTTMLYEKGKSRRELTGTDSLSWGRKSWVVGVRAAGQYRAYDWNTLTAKRILADTLGGIPVLIVVSADSSGFHALRNPGAAAAVRVDGDTLRIGGRSYRLDGRGIDTSGNLSRLPAYQEFWHSWQQFHPQGSRQ
jgi:hypothetical protein